MRRRIIFTFISFFLLILASGCENFVEPNQLAFVIGTALDHDESGVIEVSHQIVIPSQISGSEGEAVPAAQKVLLSYRPKAKILLKPTGRFRERCPAD